MLIGSLVKIKKDVFVDKYHNGYTKFPKGSLFIYNELESVGLNKTFSPVDTFEIDQPSSIILSDDEFEVLENEY